MDRSPEKDAVASDILPDDAVPLCYFTRSPALCREIFWQTACKRFVDFSPNGVDFLATAVEFKVYAVAVVKSEGHMKTLKQAGFALCMARLLPGLSCRLCTPSYPER